MSDYKIRVVNPEDIAVDYSYWVNEVGLDGPPATGELYNHRNNIPAILLVMECDFMPNAIAIRERPNDCGIHESIEAVAIKAGLSDGAIGDILKRNPRQARNKIRWNMQQLFWAREVRLSRV